MQTLPTQSYYETTEEYQERLYPFIHGRHRDGTFAVGNLGGPGRPRIDFLGRAGIKFRRNIEEMPPEVQELIQQAQRGDYAALRTITNAIEGKIALAQ